MSKDLMQLDEVERQLTNTLRLLDGIPTREENIQPSKAGKRKRIPAKQRLGLYLRETLQGAIKVNETPKNPQFRLSYRGENLVYEVLEIDNEGTVRVAVVLNPEKGIHFITNKKGFERSELIHQITSDLGSILSKEQKVSFANLISNPESASIYIVS